MYSSEEKAASRRRRTSSFSSSLLDAVYRSIDDSKSVDDLHYEQHRRREEQKEEGKTTSAKKKQSKNDNNGKQDKELENLRRAMMIESWVKKLNTGSEQTPSAMSTSASSSSESLWSSSETDSRPKPKPEKHQDNPKPCYGFSRTTKLKAMKIYGELKKVKQPISPGGRIATFLNSFFSSGNVKKAKMCYVGAVEDVTVSSADPPPPSSSRSCLVKLPQDSSRSEKRSVRFYPVSVILGEEQDGDPRLVPSLNLANKKKKMIVGSGSSERFYDDRHHREAEDEDDESCSSSDLFEIDHLVVGVGVGLRYSEELPVYETTSLKKNHAIAHGLIY